MPTSRIPSSAVGKLHLSWCLICQKWCTQEHVTGAPHKSYALTHAADSYFLGKPRVARPRTAGCPVEKAAGEEGLWTLDYGSLKAFWGANIEDFARRAADVVKERGEISIKVDEDTTVTIPSGAISGISAALVSYRAFSGKYTSSTQIVFLSDLPALLRDAEDSQWWPVAVVALEPEKRKKLGLNISAEKFLADAAGGAQVVGTASQQIIADNGEIAKPVGGQATLLSQSPWCSFVCCLRQLASADKIMAWPLAIRSRL